MNGGRAIRATAIGGGTGLPRVLTALLALGAEPTAVVTMADDGGSSGMLRAEFGMLPPGDARNCLAALAEPGPLKDLFQYRFEDGVCFIGHSLGNLALAALNEMHGGFVEALDEAQKLLRCRGRVLPSTLQDVRLSGRTVDGELIESQVAVANSEAKIASIMVTPPFPPAYPPALDAVLQADIIVIGPGSLFTSVMTNFLVGGMLDALRNRRGKSVYFCNVANQRGETAGFDAADHVAALADYGVAEHVDVVVCQAASDSAGDREHPPVLCDQAAVDRIRALGPEVVLADIVDEEDHFHHDSAKLAAVLEGML